MDFKIPYMYDFITKLCRTQNQSSTLYIQMYMVSDKDKPGIGSTMYKKFKLGSSQTYDHSPD
jgi:hypothetical protein